MGHPTVGCGPRAGHGLRKNGLMKVIYAQRSDKGQKHLLSRWPQTGGRYPIPREPRSMAKHIGKVVQVTRTGGGRPFEATRNCRTSMTRVHIKRRGRQRADGDPAAHR